LGRSIPPPARAALTDLRTQLDASLGPFLTIERELGGGGMSRVFLARDQTLDRAVVVKVLASELAAGVSADRFRREIQVVARLQHPHIVPILSAGSADGTLYYVMPFLGGETLRARLSRERVLPVADAVRVLREMLDALAFAHGHGVIHRDIKPENILVEAGHAIVADFGISKALRESSGLTSIGVAVGTPGYMAPEQATADPSADHRADLYAVGCVAWEMLSGEPLFSGSPQQLLRAHLVEAPRSLKERRSDVPDALADLVMRALAKEPAERPQSAAEMLVALETVSTPGTQSLPATAAVPAPARRRRGLMISAVALLVVIAGVGGWRATRPTVLASAQSLMVAPFTVASGDTALIRLGQNLVTTVSANVDGVGEIRATDPVAALANARAKGDLLSAADAMEIARRLGARSVLHGTLAPTGATVRADAVLYDALTGAQLTRVSVTAPADSLTALTDSITWGLLRAVWNRGRAPTPNYSSITTNSPVALREFLEGERQFARQDWVASSDAYRRAIAADSTFWFAYYRNRLVRGWIELPPDTTLNRKLREHRHALPERERDLIIAVDSVSSQSDRVQRYRQLVERYPGYAPALVTYADFLIHHAIRSGHDVGEAIEPWRQLTKLMPQDISAADHVLWACIGIGDIECARQAFVRYDSLVRADSAPPMLTVGTHRMLLHGLMPSRPALTDSLLRAGARDSLVIPPLGIVRHAVLVASPDDSGLVREWDRLAVLGERTVTRMPGIGDVLHFILLHDRVARGDVSEIDRLSRLRVPAGGTPTASLRARAITDLLRMTTPDSATAQAAAQIAARPELSRSSRMDAQWLAGFNALLRGDSVAFERQLVALSRDSSVHARIASRSLRAIRQGNQGGQHRAAAAESLLVLERAHGENAPKVWSAFAVDRLLAAQWLAEGQRYAPADSLLRFVSAFTTGATAEVASVVSVPSLLVKSRIHEGLGNNDLAVRHAKAFLMAFDKAPPSQKPLLDEARARIARLGRVEAKDR